MKRDQDFIASSSGVDEGKQMFDLLLLSDKNKALSLTGIYRLRPATHYGNGTGPFLLWGQKGVQDAL